MYVYTRIYIYYTSVYTHAQNIGVDNNKVCTPTRIFDPRHISDISGAKATKVDAKHCGLGIAELQGFQASACKVSELGVATSEF